MTPITWSSDALDDVGAHERRLSNYSQQSLHNFRRRIGDAVSRLAEFPESGRIVPEFGEGRFRELILPPYRLLYLIDASEVHIVAVVHGSVDLTGFADDD